MSSSTPLERLTLGPPSNVQSNGPPPLPLGLGHGDGSESPENKPPRLPRWTRQEILVLIQGKRVAESRVSKKRGRFDPSDSGDGSAPEPKWAAISAYCKRHGVDRGPVQCRKRWSNLAGDYKKIKEWDSANPEPESFWSMRNDSRRERKLPGFFDREVFDVLEGRSPSSKPISRVSEEVSRVSEARVSEIKAEVENGGFDGGRGPRVSEKGRSPRILGGGEGGFAGGRSNSRVLERSKGAEVIFDSGRPGNSDEGLFSDFEQSGREEGEEEKDMGAMPESPSTPAPPPPIIAGIPSEKQPAANPEKGSSSQAEHKRRRVSGEEEGSDSPLRDQLLQLLERNSRVLTAQLEAQNLNCQLDRNQRKDHAESLVGVLNKLADALGRIADKL
ncbi:hypothetical protein AMTRI_Chr06g170830 [Amborella trichopoda]